MRNLQTHSKGISFFDLDHTLLSANSGFKFGLHLFSRRHISSVVFVKLLWAYWRHLRGALSIVQFYERAGALFFLGRPLSLFQEETERFLTEQWSKLQYPLGSGLLDQAKKRGDAIVILSSGPDFLVGAIAKRLGVESSYGTSYQVNAQGVVSSVTEVMEGEAKARKVLEVVQLSGGGIATYGYSDSHHDIPFLHAVQHACAVAPTRQLEREARLQGWQIVRS